MTPVDLSPTVVAQAERLATEQTLDLAAQMAWVVAGHDHADPHAAAHAPGPASIGPEAVTSALSPELWDVVVTETMHDLVVRARRTGSS